MSDEKQTYDSIPDTLRHIEQVQIYLSVCIDRLQARMVAHDLSKLQEPERSMFDKYTPLLRETTYGSDEYKAHLQAMGIALQHHYQENDHHPEHFENGIEDMHMFQLIEMLCDWIAASKRHADGDMVKSLEINQKRFNISPELQKLLVNTVREIWAWS